MSESHLGHHRRSTVTSESFIDHKPFLSDRFDVHDYANAVLQGRPYLPDLEDDTDAGPSREKGDLGIEVARLNYGIEDVTKQLRQEITASYPLLLSHLTTSMALSSQLAPIRSSLGSLSSSLERLHGKIHTPHTQLALMVRRLSLLALASDLARRAARFVLVARRLETQMANVARVEASDGAEGKGEGEREREMAKAALSVAELDVLLAEGEGVDGDGEGESRVARQRAPEDDEPEGEPRALPLQTLDFVRAYIPVIDKARDTIIAEMEAMVMSGLAGLNHTLLSSSLQTAHNLGLLPDLVANLVADLNDAVTLRVARAFDSAAIGREVSGKETTHAIKFTTRSRSSEPTSATLPQWQNALWVRLSKVIEEVANCCIKVYTLQKVLRVKRDAVTQVEFLDEVMKTLDEKPSFTFWTTLAKAFEAQTKEAAKTSGWLQQTLSTGYPRLLRLFHDFFAKIAVHMDTVYTMEHQSPEAVLVLRSVSTFETLYLSRSTTRMSEAVTSAMSQYVASRGTAPGAAEGVNIARTITNELDSARFDPLLVRTVARSAAKVLNTLKTRIDSALMRDFTATSLIGPQATPAEVLNAQLVSCLYHCAFNLTNVGTQFGAKVGEIIAPGTKALEASYRRITDALDVAIRREFATILARIHRVDFSKPVDPMAAAAGAPYMQDLLDKLVFLRAEILGRMSLGEFMRAWVLQLSQFLIRTFLLHASIARPMGESGRLKLTGNMAEFELGLQNFLTTGRVSGTRGLPLSAIGDEYLALRAFRTLLFSPTSTLSNPVDTVHLPPLVVAHHAVVRSPLRLPHEVHGWSEAEYVLWVDKHTERESWDLLEKATDAQVDTSQSAGRARAGLDKDEEEAVRLVKEVLAHARHHLDHPECEHEP